MIHHEKTRDGGKLEADGVQIQFSLSHPVHTHTLCVTARGKDRFSVLTAAVESLCERYSPCVLHLHCNNTRALFQPQVHRLHRCWTGNGQAVFVEGREHRKSAAEVCTLAQAVHNRVLLRQGTNKLEFYESQPLLRDIRRMTRPLEWASVHEEFMYETSGAGIRGVYALTEAVTTHIDSVQTATLREYYSHAAARLNALQHERGQGFDLRRSCFAEAATQLVLPTLVLLTDPHPFRTAVYSAFVNSGSEYISKTTEFINGYASVISDLLGKSTPDTDT